MSTHARPLVHQDETLREVQRFVDREFERRPPSDVLDAGCGYTLPLDFPRSVRLVGLDASAEALAKNRNIDEGVVGDIETHPIGTDEFDAIVCWNVLEHLSNPRAAIANMARGLRSGGLLVVGIPNLWSLKGLVTKLTPHGFHIWVYRRILGKKDAGKPGFGPYPTYLKREIAPERLHQVARAHGLERVYASTYEVDFGLPRGFEALWSVVTTAARILTLGTWNAAASDHVAVFRRSTAS